MSLKFLKSSFGHFIVINFKNIGSKQEALNDDLYLTILGAIISQYNCLSRIIWGYFMDKSK